MHLTEEYNKWMFELTKDTSHIALTGELCGACWKYFGKKILRCNGTALQLPISGICTNIAFGG